MNEINFKLLDDLMNLYFGVGIFLLVLIMICIAVLIVKIALYLNNENEKITKINTKRQVKEILKEIKENETE